MSSNLIRLNDALQAHPEFLNEQIDDHDKAVYAKGWNACNSAYIQELNGLSPVGIVHCQECKHYKYGRHFSDIKFCARYRDNDGKPVYYNTMPDDFCSRGEVSEDA